MNQATPRTDQRTKVFWERKPPDLYAKKEGQAELANASVVKKSREPGLLEENVG